jgi:hypothetical protein
LISFRAISTNAKGAASYFRNRISPISETGEINPEADSRDRLVAYYTGRNAQFMWREDMPLSVAKALGIDLTQTPRPKEFERLYEGKRADTGEKWSPANREISAYDFTFSPHKSVTLAAEFAQDPAEAAAIRAAIARANDDAMRYIAKEIGWARKGKDGRQGAEPGCVGWASYTHYDARPTVPLQDGRHGKTEDYEAPIPGDPQEHIHNTLFNLVVTADGRIGSLDTKRMHSRIHEFGAYAQARLADELRQLGIRLAYDEKEQAVVIPAIPRIANETFSKSRQQILTQAKTHASAQGLDWDDLSAEHKKQIIASAASAARLAKHGDKTDQEFWRAQAKAIGWEHKSVLEGLAHQPLTDEQRLDRAYDFAARHLAREFATASVLDHDRLRLYAARGLIGTGVSIPEDIDRVVALLEDKGFAIDGEKVSLISAWVKKPVKGSAPREVLRVTHSAQVRIEKDLIAEVKRAVSDTSGALKAKAIKAAIAASSLDFSAEPEHGKKQIAAIHALGQGGAISLLTGYAGSGKSALLQPLVRAWKAHTKFDARGRELIGVSTAWSQADQLQDADIEHTIAVDPFLKALDSGDILPTQNTIVVIDEVSQVGPKSMLRLLKTQAATGMTIKAIGDREQAQSIDAGDTIEILRRALPAAALPELLSTVRQRAARNRKIATLFRDGKAGEALAMKREDGTALLLGGDEDQAAGAIADFFLQRRDMLRASGTKKTITITAPTNEEVALISMAIRDRLKERGEIGSDETLYKAIAPRGPTSSIAFNLPIATGDHVRLFRRTKALINEREGTIGNNGHILKVAGRSDTHLFLEDKKGRIGAVKWGELIHEVSGRLMLGFGYAHTIDAAQGMTSDEHINALLRGSGAITGFKAYVAESRARGDTWTMVSEAATRAAIRQARPLGSQKPIADKELWDRIAEDMSFKPYKSLGIDLMDAARNARHKTTNSFLNQSHSSHAWAASDQDEGAAARERAHEKILTGRLSDHIAALKDAIDHNAALLRETLHALEAYLKSKTARSAPVSQPAPPDEAPRPSTPTPGL